MITIVGGGPVGSLLSILLRQQGFEVCIYEKRSDPRHVSAAAGRSINLVITSRGLFGLEKAGLTSIVEKIAVPVFGRMIHPKAADPVYQPYGQKSECNYSISRGELNNHLISEAEKIGVKIYFDRTLESVDTTEKKIIFTDGKNKFTATYDILLGTDGSGSRLRKLMAQKFPNLTDQTTWLEADYKELTLPLGADGKPQLKTDALHIWPRGAHMMMALANLDGSFTVTVYLPKNSSLTNSIWGFNQINSGPDIEKLFSSEFGDAIRLMPNYKNEFQKNPQGQLGTVRCNQWVFEDSIALLGDAAHAIVPFFGQGMNLGFEDCTTLLTLLEKNSNNWPETLRQFEKVQKPNADAIADMALENWDEMKDKVGDPRFLFRKKIEAALEQKYPGVFKTRYGMITYTLIPYTVAKQAGLIQSKIVDKLMTDANNIDEVSWQKADALMRELWDPFVKLYGLEACLQSLN